MFKKIINLMFMGLSVVYSTCPQSSCAMESIQHNPSHATNLETNIRGAMSTLLKHNDNFAFFDLNLLQNEIDTLKKLKIEQGQRFDYNVEKIENLESELKQHIKTVGTPYHSTKSFNEESANEASKIIIKLVGQIIQASGQETARVILTSFEPSAAFVLPRWHTDGYALFNKHDGNQYKFTIALKGASTLFYRLPPDKKEQFSALYAKPNNDNRRTELAQFLDDPNAILAAKSYQGAIFIQGSHNAAIHSEPNITEPRLFLGVLPCSKLAIRKWLDEIKKKEEELDR